MSKGRLEAFSDGMIAIFITIMVLELKVPHGHDWSAIRPLAPAFLSYVLSFIYLGIYWNNHHHLLQAAGKINGKVLWANLHLLFWLSLFPITTAWVGENPSAPVPAALYGSVFLLAAVAYTILYRTLVGAQAGPSKLEEAVGPDLKGKISMLMYLCAIPLAYVRPWLSYGVYAAVALIWLVPDRRIERKIAE